ncbi:uracil-xanthine permease [Amylibacter sp. SFDW26]|uniref:uracil-xanthine permease family protein n=1 Tax=Amylibacter sp. SFDW26 TaxID=2652722 RepID=UPI0012625837|nr:uracil-xanthine permease family protein [Amylibacter sp. SFDW26]KAB7615598.1 uracil-xanthine permease [Amylibacter sp. SFDW26]
MSHSAQNTDYSFGPENAVVGAQMLFVAFGALVLVPILTGLDPNVALFTAGLGTLVFQLVTKGQVPVFLASSFAFIAPIIYGVQTWGMAATTGGLAFAGLFYVAISFAVRAFGSGFIHRLLPPVVVGPVIMVIGLSLAPIAINMASGVAGTDQIFPKSTSLVIAAITLAATVLTAILGKGMMKIVPIIVGIVVGYIASLIIGPLMGTGLVNFGNVGSAPWFAVPAFVAPEFQLAAILYILPVAIAPAIEHFGDIVAIGGVTKKDYLEKPGIQNTMLGDGLATTAAGLLGGPPNTTYSEVTGAVTLTKAFNPGVMTWAAIFAIILAFVGKLGALLGTIPMPVMGGIMILMFGLITTVGLSVLMKAKDDLSDARNMSIISIILVVGVGGLAIQFGGGFALGGIGLAGVLGVLLNLFLPKSAE